MAAPVTSDSKGGNEMTGRIINRVVAYVLISSLTLGLVAALPPVPAQAASQFLTNISLTSLTTSSATVSFYYGKDGREHDVQLLEIGLYDTDSKVVGWNIFALIWATYGRDLRGTYTHTFTGLTPGTQYYAKIHGMANDKDYYSDPILIATPAAGQPQFSLEVTRNRNDIYLAGRITSTGTGHTIRPDGSILNPANEQVITHYGTTVRDSTGQAVYSKPWTPFSETGMFFGVPELLPAMPGVIRNPYTIEVSLRNRHGQQASATVAFRVLAPPIVTTHRMTYSAYSATAYGGSLACGIYVDPFDELQTVTATRSGTSQAVAGVLDQTDNLYKWYFDGLAPAKDYVYYIDAYCKSGQYRAIAELVYTTGPAPSAPQVSTVNASSIKPDGAKLTGSVTSNGNANIVSRGFVYATIASGNNDPSTLIIGGIGVTQKTVASTVQQLPADFHVHLAELPAGTGYYYRAYARNAAGLTAYGAIKSFATLTTPSVTTGEHTRVRTESVELSGTVVSTGGSSPTFRGFVLSQQADPQLGAAGVIFTMGQDVSADPGAYVTAVSGLVADSAYYYRAYILNAKGTFYGAERSFTTQPYANVPTVKLGLVSLPPTRSNQKEVNATFTAPASVTVTGTGFVYSLTPNPARGGAGVTSVDLTDVDGSFATTLTNLAPATTYYYKAYATDGKVTGYSAQGQFATPAQLTAGYSVPIVTGTEVIETTATTATIETEAYVYGGAHPRFQRLLAYSVTNNDPKPDGPGVTTIWAALGGLTNDGVTRTTIEGLTANTTYYLRAVTSNQQGQDFGIVITVVTDDAGLPVVTNATTPVTNVSNSAATINAHINPSGSTVTRYGVVYSSQDPVLSGVASLTALVLSPVTLPAPVAVNLTGLTGGTVYYYRSFAENSAGLAYGEIGQFATPPSVPPNITTSPSVTPGPTSAGTTMSVGVEGTGSKRLAQVGVVFSTNAEPLIAGPGVLTVHSSVTTLGDKPFSLSGLTPNTSYHMRSFGVAMDGTVYYGKEVAFKTTALTAPAVTAYGYRPALPAAAEVFSGVTDSGGSEVTARGVVYGTTPAPRIGGAGVTHIKDSAAGLGEFTAALQDLKLDTSYYVRAYATNKLGTTYSSDILVALTKPSEPAAPTVVTNAVSAVTATGATVLGAVLDDNGSDVTEYGFVYGISANPDTSTGTKIRSSAGAGNFSETLTGLQTGSTYYVRAYAVNERGTGYGESRAVRPGAAQPDATAIRLYIGKNGYFINDTARQMDTAPIIRESRTLLPIRFVAEPLGATVGWDGAEQKVTVSLGTRTIELWIGNNRARVNGGYQYIDPANLNVVPIIVPPGRTMLPVRFVTEALGCQVRWDQDTQEVTITYPAP